MSDLREVSCFTGYWLYWEGFRSGALTCVRVVWTLAAAWATLSSNSKSRALEPLKPASEASSGGNELLSAPSVGGLSCGGSVQTVSTIQSMTLVKKELAKTKEDFWGNVILILI